MRWISALSVLEQALREMLALRQKLESRQPAHRKWGDVNLDVQTPWVPAYEAVGTLKTSRHRLGRQTRLLDAEAFGQPGETPPPAPGQYLRLPAREAEKAGRIARAAVGQGAEHRERQWYDLPQSSSSLGLSVRWRTARATA